MKTYICRFTLVEMLTVIGIIIILAGLIIPTVSIARTRGKISSAQSDITSIMAAMKNMAADYHGRMLDKDGSNYKIGGVTASVSSDIASLTGDAYDAMIVELSAPKNTGFSPSVNRRRNTYLDPRQDFDPTKSYSTQTGTLYRDPWGNPYFILIKVTYDDSLAIPGTSRTIPGNAAVYSFGPNGEDLGAAGNNNGCNEDNSICGSSDCECDDISSWDL